MSNKSQPLLGTWWEWRIWPYPRLHIIFSVWNINVWTAKPAILLNAHKPSWCCKNLLDLSTCFIMPFVKPRKEAAADSCLLKALPWKQLGLCALLLQYHLLSSEKMYILCYNCVENTIVLISPKTNIGNKKSCSLGLIHITVETQN